MNAFDEDGKGLRGASPRLFPGQDKPLGREQSHLGIIGERALAAPKLDVTRDAGVAVAAANFLHRQELDGRAERVADGSAQEAADGPFDDGPFHVISELFPNECRRVEKEDDHAGQVRNEEYHPPGVC